MQYREPTYAEGVWDVFWYEKNLQGDVVAVYNASGSKLVAYTYDAWGNHTATYYNGGTATAAIKNPFRYRGYYYDSDLGLYYLNSRYYDANTGRFINADRYISTGQGILGYNMYAYCGNNPVNYVDYSGDMSIPLPFPVPLELLVLGAVIIGTGLLIYDATHNQLIGNMFTEVLDGAADIVDNVVDGFKSLTESKVEAKEEVVTPTQQYNYWTASIVDDVVTPGVPLTYSQAREWVAQEKDLLCRDHASAIAIVKYYPTAIWEPAHRGGLECGYLNHYHLSSAHNNHIWYYGE